MHLISKYAFICWKKYDVVSCIGEAVSGFSENILACDFKHILCIYERLGLREIHYS